MLALDKTQGLVYLSISILFEEYQVKYEQIEAEKGTKMTNQELFLVFGGVVTCYAGYLFFKAYLQSKNNTKTAH